MKNFSKILFISLSVLVLSVHPVRAQLGIQAGYAFTPSKGNLELGTNQEYSATFRNSGFQGGLTYDFKIKGEFGLHTGILYSIFAGKSTQAETTIYNIKGDLTTTSNYQFLDLPIRVTYSLPVTNDFKIFFFGGPNLTYALSGSSESIIKGTINNTTISRQLRKYENVYKDFENDIIRFDLKAGVGGGVQYKKLVFKVGYDWGLLNSYTGLIEKNSDDKKYKLHRGQLGVSLAFLLWR